jgi:uncharacterized protein YicC (UPF0701 family)
MSNNHITHSDDSHFSDISLTPHDRIDGEHKLTFHNDSGMSTSMRLSDEELDQLAEVVQTYKDTRDGIGYTFILDARDVLIAMEEQLDEGMIYTEEEERLLRKFLERGDVECRSIISDALQHSAEMVLDVDFYDSVRGIINTATNIIIANLRSKQY